MSVSSLVFCDASLALLLSNSSKNLMSASIAVSTTASSNTGLIIIDISMLCMPLPTALVSNTSTKFLTGKPEASINNVDSTTSGLLK